jgi:O-methyltransferase
VQFVVISDLFVSLRRNLRLVRAITRTLGHSTSSTLYFLVSVPVRDYLLVPSKVRLLLKVKPYSMLSYRRLSALFDAANEVVERRIPGDIVECGVCNGGSAAVLAAVSSREPGRRTWLFDSWRGFPPAESIDVSDQGHPAGPGMDLGYLSNVRRILFEELKLDPPRISIVEGWFSQTVAASRNRIGTISLLHLDCDLYESVRTCLEALFDLVSPGGFVFIDDYGNWAGCRSAVDEFLMHREDRNLRVNHVDNTGIYLHIPVHTSSRGDGRAVDTMQ